MYFDPMYFLFLAPAMGVVLIAQIIVKATFAKYSKVTTHSGTTGAQAARLMLERQGVTDVQIEAVAGKLTDHYDPRSKTLRLSSDVYASPSLSAIGVACHEAGHALQHAQGYRWLGLRTAMVPVTGLGSNLAPIIIILGIVLNAAHLVMFGIILFSAVVAFTLITLPVEWDASHRAKLAMTETGLLTVSESAQAGSVLNAAFLTYLASALSAIMTLIYYLFRAGLLGNSRRSD